NGVVVVGGEAVRNPLARPEVAGPDGQIPDGQRHSVLQVACCRCGKGRTGPVRAAARACSPLTPRSAGVRLSPSGATRGPRGDAPGGGERAERGWRGVSSPGRPDPAGREGRRPRRGAG